MTDYFAKVVSFDPLIVGGVEGPQGSPGPSGPAGPSGPEGPQGQGYSLNYAGVKTANYAANVNEFVHLDNSLNSFTVQMPVSPANGDRVAFRSYALTRPNKTTILASPGQSFEAGQTSAFIDTAGEGYEFQWFASTSTWAARVVSMLPDSLKTIFDAVGSAQAVSDTLTPQIQALQNRPPSAVRQSQFHLIGALCLGFMALGLEIAQGFTAGACEATLDVAADADIHIDAYVGGSVVYTFVIPAGQTTVLDSNPTDPQGNSGIGLADGAFVTFKVTQCGSLSKPGRNISILFAEQIGPKLPPSVGSVGNLTATPQPAALALAWGYQAKDTADELDHFALRYLQGDIAPASINDGTALPDVPATSSANYTANFSGAASTDYSIGVFPVGTDGQVGTAAFVTATTSAVTDTTPPGTGSIALAPNPGSVTVTITEPTDADFVGGWLRRQNLSQTPPATPTSNRPAGGGWSATGAGLWVPKGTTVIVDGNLNYDVDVAYAYFSQDSSGNVNQTGAGNHTHTLAAPASAQGDGGLIPASATYGTGTGAKTFTYSQEYTTDFSAGNAMLDTHGGTEINVEGPSWKNQTQGPAEPTNVDIIADPDNPANNILRMRQRYITNGFYNSNYWSYKTDFADNGTDGTGWYGSRLQWNGHYITYGALQFRCRIGDANGAVPTALSNNIKGGNFMWYTDQSTAATKWPQDELDLWEVFQNGLAEINNHCLNSGSSNTNQQCYNRWNLDLTKWTWVTCLIEPAPAGTNGNGRLRVWYRQDGVDIGAGVGVASLRMDTNTPYVGSNMGIPKGATKANADCLLSPQANKFVGLSLEWTHYYETGTTIKQATFTAGTGTGSTQRQAGSFVVDSMTLWNAVAS